MTADTGRLRQSEPVLQHRIPRTRVELQRPYIEFDYAEIELRILSYLMNSKDKAP